MKKWIKILRRVLSRVAVYFFVALFEKMPYGVGCVLARAFSGIAFYVLGAHRQVAEQTINIAFSGEKPLHERRSIIHRCFKSFAQSAVEVIRTSVDQDFIDKIIKIEGKNRLTEALAKGKGVIAVTAHFGNFPLLLMYFAIKGFPMKAIVRPLRDEKLEAYIKEKYAKVGFEKINSIPRQECVLESLKALRNKEMLFVPIDQNLSVKGGVFVNFFGRDAATPTGPVVFARRSGAMILPIFIVRQNDDTHKIIIEEPFQVVEKENEQETYVFYMQKITSLVERYIRQYPSQWAWMNHRWKNQFQ